MADTIPRRTITAFNGAPKEIRAGTLILMAEMPDCTEEGCNKDILTTEYREMIGYRRQHKRRVIDPNYCHDHSEQTCKALLCRRPRGNTELCPAHASAKARRANEEVRLEAERQRDKETGNILGKVVVLTYAIYCPHCDYCQASDMQSIGNVSFTCDGCGGLFKTLERQGGLR